MKITTYIALTTLLLIGCKDKKGPDTDPWLQADEIAAQISSPTFPIHTILVTDFGALADGTDDALPAITTAIEKCASQGGGTVKIPAGVYQVNGPIYLKSNVNLHVDKGATLRFSTTPSHYLPAVRTRWEGVELMNYSPLIYAYDETNIAITGEGTLDGQASNDNWWPWCGKDIYGWREGMPRQQDEDSRKRLFTMNELQTPVDQRQFGEGTYLRPNFIQTYKCKNVLIDGVTIKNSPMWVVHPVLSENIIIKNIRVISHGPNSDGCDPESCKNVLIQNCYFDTGDDCIALKSGRNQDGRRLATPIENVLIQDCIMKDGHGGVVIGSEVSGGARNIFAENCQMDSPNLDRAIRVKTNKTRGGAIENLYFRKIIVGEVKEAVIKVNMNYTISSNPEQYYIPTVRNIHIDEVQSSKSAYAVLIDGYDEEHKVENIHITHCQFNGVAQGNSVKNVSNLKLNEVYINGELIR